MHDEVETVFERFEIVWPPEIADAGSRMTRLKMKTAARNWAAFSDGSARSSRRAILQ